MPKRGRHSANPKKQQNRIAGLFIAGVLIFCVACLTFEPAYRTVRVAQNRSEFIPADFEVVWVKHSGGRRQSDVRGRLNPSGREVEVNSSSFDEMMESTNGTVFFRKTPEALMGLHVPVWYQPSTGYVLSQKRNPELPDTGVALCAIALSGGMLAVSAVCLWKAIAAK